MKTVKCISELKDIVKSVKMSGQTIGLVPTMGYFHEGHLSLMKRAKSESDFVIVSLFVNPTQFGPNEDFEAYPRDLDRDLSLCRETGVDVVFAPEVIEMYPEGYSTYVDCEGGITKALCGKSRPGHFKGVTSVVTKLFNLAEPDKAFFGQKDAQQVAVIEKMVRDLNMTVCIVPCDIVREEDGLAMSSRNVYLSKDERQEALVLSQALNLAEALIANGERSAQVVKAAMMAHIETAKSATIDYVSIVSSKTLEDIDVISGDILMALAVKVGKPRLIDNRRIKLEV